MHWAWVLVGIFHIHSDKNQTLTQREREGGCKGKEREGGKGGGREGRKRGRGRKK